MGDLNAIIASHEKKKRGTLLRSSSSSQCLKQAIDNLGLIDIGFSGPNFTWDNRRVGGLANIQERLDRALTTDSWLHSNPISTLSHLPMGSSDHCPILLCTMDSQISLPSGFIKDRIK